MDKAETQARDFQNFQWKKLKIRKKKKLKIPHGGHSGVTGGPPLSGALSLYPFGIKESPNGTSLAMYPLVDFALQAQGYVSKGRSFLSDAPFGRFSLPHPRVRQEGTALA